MALAMSATNALPISRRDPYVQVDPDKAVCDRHGINYPPNQVIFEVNIGRPYIEGAGCEDVKRDITEAISPSGRGPGDWKCEDNGQEGTFLSFTTYEVRGTTIGVIDGLQKGYPMVPFQKERICLGQGMEEGGLPDYWPSPP